jgi:hypothetical protein
MEQREDDELVELPGGITMTWAEWRELFNRIRATPITIPLKMDLELAKHSNF